MSLKRKNNDNNSRSSIVAKLSLAILGEFKTLPGKFNVLVDMILAVFVLVSLVKPISYQIISVFRDCFMNSDTPAADSYDSFILIIFFLAFSLVCLLVMCCLEKEMRLTNDSLEEIANRKNNSENACQESNDTDE